MTPDSVRKYKAEIAALGDGKTIQRRYKIGNAWLEWIDDSDPNFTSSYLVEFRIKPEPRELWIVTDKTGNWSGHSFSSEVEAKNRFGYMNRDQYEIIHYKEVL